MHIQGSQLTLRNVRASLQTYSLRAPPSCLGLQQRWKQPSPSTCQIGQSRQANALRLRLDPGNYVGDRVESVDPDRANVPCTLFLYRGTFSARQFSDVLVPLQTGDPCRLTGAGDGCYCWAGYTHELVALPWILGAGFGCINCKDTLRDAAYVVYLVSVWS